MAPAAVASTTSFSLTGAALESRAKPGAVVELEADYLRFGSGAVARVRAAAQQATLVIPCGWSPRRT